jgi:hypothetical protein
MSVPVTANPAFRQAENESILLQTSAIIIGISGHMDLLGDREQLKRMVEKKVAKIRNLPENKGRDTILLSAMAPGADQLIAGCAGGNVELVVLRAMKNREFRKQSFDLDKDDPDSQEWINYRNALLHNRFIETFEPYKEKAPSQGQAQNGSAPVSGDWLTEEEKQEVNFEPSQSTNEMFVANALCLIKHCDHLIALWDGVDGGGEGGTSDVVRKWTRGKIKVGDEEIDLRLKTRTLHQLVVPRAKNHFPIGRRFHAVYSNFPPGEMFTWVITEFPRVVRPSLWSRIRRCIGKYKAWLAVGIPLLTLIWFYAGMEANMEDGGIVLLVGALYASAAWFYHRYKHVRDLLLRFLFPMVMGLLVLLLGSIGFAPLTGGSGDTFFSAAELISLGANDIDQQLNFTTPEMTHGHVICLQFARLLGGFLAGYIFVLGFALAAGKENISRFRFWVFRHVRDWLRYVRKKIYETVGDGWMGRLFRRFLDGITLLNREFYVVIGDGTMALNVVLDLLRQKKKVVFLDEGSDPKVSDYLVNEDVWYFKGNMTSREGLRKTYFWNAADTYIMSESDEENFRIVQEMDEIFQDEKKSGKSSGKDKKPSWFVHLMDLQERGLLQNFARNTVRGFSVYENSARRILQRFPNDRFSGPLFQEKKQTVQVIIFGFGQLGQEIALSALGTGQYCGRKYLQVKVYHTSDEQPLVDRFRASHPEFLFPPEQNAPASAKVARYTFFTRTAQIIDFELLPEAESLLGDPDFSLYNLIRPEHVVSIYGCMSSGIRSAALLGSVLPRIEWLKQDKSGNMNGQTDVQAFCFYNFPDKDEEEFVEQKLNAIAPGIPVFCFGNFIKECSEEAIRNETSDFLAKQIALLYACLYGSSIISNSLPGLKTILNSIDQDLEAVKIRDHEGNEITDTKVLNNLKNIIKAKRTLPHLLLPDISMTEYNDWLNTIWENTPEDEKESNRQAADHAWIKFREMGKADTSKWERDQLADFWNENQKALLAELEHRRWNAEKLIKGWNPNREADWKKHKTALKAQRFHQFMVTFDELDDFERNKDWTQIIGLPFFFYNILIRNGIRQH